VDRYGKGTGTIGENLSFGQYVAGPEVIMALYIDDGVKNRGHRRALQNPAYNYTGIAHCQHRSQYTEMIAIAYATNFSLNSKGFRRIQK
jgi:uncharacterized protein YkwD